MKKEFTIFYSWQSDLPAHDNKNYINKVLRNVCAALEKKYNIRISIDSDSKGTSGSQTIEDAILNKIARCDLFVADVSPISIIKEGKAIANSNVMYELGYASALLGKCRVINVWNEAYGNVKDGPFDINHYPLIMYYKKDESDNFRQLQLQSLLEDKIVNFESLISNDGKSKEEVFDRKQFYAIFAPESEDYFRNKFNTFLSTRQYSEYDFELLSGIFDRFYNPQSHFINSELRQGYASIIDQVRVLIDVCIVYGTPFQRPSIDAESVKERIKIKQQTMYKIRDPYTIFPTDKAQAEEQHVYQLIMSISQTMTKAYTDFRHSVQRILYV